MNQKSTVTFYMMESQARGDFDPPLSRGSLIELPSVTNYTDAPLRKLLLQSLSQTSNVSSATTDFIKDGYFRFAILPLSADFSSFNLPIHHRQYIEWRLDPCTGTVSWGGPPFLQMSENLTFSILQEMVDAGYITGDPGRLFVEIVVGVGGGGIRSDIVNWLLDQGVDIGTGAGLSWIFGQAFRGLRNGSVDRRARKTAALWAARNMDSPDVLRHFLETKTTWTVDEVARRLDLGARASTRLLRSLGYARNALDEWEPGISGLARHRRRKWLRAEEDF